MYTDFDDDNHIGPTDLEQVVKLLTRGQLTTEEMAQVCEKVIEEGDVDGDGKLSYMEFEHVILRAPDFLGTFHIRVWIHNQTHTRHVYNKNNSVSKLFVY